MPLFKELMDTYKDFKAICALYDPGESFPYIDATCKGDECRFCPCDETRYEYWQPDALDDEEFNMVILLNGALVRVRGCHFDFICEDIE